MGLFLVIAVIATLIAARKSPAITYFSPVPPTCSRCKYDLSASLNAPACPECGLDWHDATTRYQPSNRLHFDTRAMHRALVAWLIVMVYAIATPYLAPAIIATNYWLDGIHGFDFVRVVHAREMYYASPLPLNYLLATSSTICVLPLIAARRQYVYALLVPIAFVIDATYWAFIYQG